jgi:small-conductance mechanosensitive channel
MPLKPLTPDKTASLRAAIRAVDSKVRPDFRRAMVCAVLAFILDGAAPYFGGVHAATLEGRLVAYGAAAGFVVFGLAATRSAASELTRVSLSRAGAAAATPLRVACLLVGYLIVALTAMDLFALPIGNLLVGGAVTGMIVGIAAQQSLSNVFAGFVLLFARPYIPGEKVRIRSGALGGTLDGTVTSVGLLYTTLSTQDGVLNIPNGGLLAAAVGPLPREEEPPTRPTQQLVLQRP